MLAQNNSVFEETCETVYKLNQNNEVRYLCEMREEGQRIMRTYQNMLKRRDAAIAKKDSELAEKDAALSKKDSELAEKDSIIAALQAQLEAYQKQ